MRRRIEGVRSGWQRLLVIVVAAGALHQAAAAYCSYKGVMYAEPSLEQEYADATWVVRVRVESALDRTVNGPWTLYELRVLEVFKGTPPKPLKYFTERNSGGFYLGGKRSAACSKKRCDDFVGDYLLFLNPGWPRDDLPPGAENWTAINANCGQSGPWAEVLPDDRVRLQKMSAAYEARD